MTEADKIGVNSGRGWKPSIVMLREWKRLAPTKHLLPGAEIADSVGLPTRYFVAAWRDAFGATSFLPPLMTIIRDGKPTREFVKLIEAVS